MNTGDVESLARTIDEFVLPDAQIRTPLPIDATGAEKLKQVWSMLVSVYPDLHVAVDDLIAAGDKIVVRNTVTGTQQGEFMGRPPTGRS
ncbi:MAG: ester cyclase [Mycobacterium sp.]